MSVTSTKVFFLLQESFQKGPNYFSPTTVSFLHLPEVACFRLSFICKHELEDGTSQTNVSSCLEHVNEARTAVLAYKKRWNGFIN